jgi:diketogulonate reductase-like aldo/keto reductase
MDIKTTVTLNNGTKIPVLGLGTWKSTGKECENAVLYALNVGYRHIDTAAAYDNEISVGNAIKKSAIPRKDIFITTKLWNDDHGNVEKAFNESLKKLQVDYVDLYLMHFPVPERNDSWKVMEKIYREGKAKAIGVSNFTIRHLKQLLENADVIPAVNQVEFHPYLYQKELLDFCNKNKIKVEAYSPLTHGHKIEDPKLGEIAAEYNKTPAQILIRWGLQHNLIVLPKSLSKERIIENSSVFDFNIIEKDMKKLDSFNEGLRTCWDPTNAP